MGRKPPSSVAGVNALLEKCDRLFDRVRKEVEGIERSKEDDARKFASFRLPANFAAIDDVKAAAVQLSSFLLELAVQESRKVRSTVGLDGNGRVAQADISRVRASLHMLWRCFQFAFRVYSFAGGQDEAAEELSLAVAKEMEAYPAHIWG